MWCAESLYRFTQAIRGHLQLTILYCETVLSSPAGIIKQLSGLSAHGACPPIGSLACSL